MAKRRKLRLTDNEVGLVAEMQRKIDFYERYIMELWMMVRTQQPHSIIEGDYSSPMTGDIYTFIKDNLNKEQ